MNDDKKRTITFEISRELADKLKERAKEREQSMSGILRSLIMEEVKDSETIANQ